MEHAMKPRKFLLAACALLILSAGIAQSHDEDESKGQLGKVAFPNSCEPKVQALFVRGVAMLHSFWFSEARKTFDAAAQIPLRED